MSITFAKGHGTENDFVLLDDPDGTIDLTPGLIRALCDRRAGLGGDGVIRVVRTAALGPTPGPTPGGGPPVMADPAPEWFMDYWNADGSVAEMCGNGVRVFVFHLARRGLIELPDGGRCTVATRAGAVPVRRDGDLLGAGLGGWRLPAGAAGLAAGGDVKVALAGLPVLPGLTVHLSNPHVVVVLPDLATLAAVDLTVAPVVDPAPPGGINVELVVPLPDSSEAGDYGHLRMRVHERGSGETRSCGTGAVAAALAVRALAGAEAPDTWRVDVPGGTLHVTAVGGPVAGDATDLSGPAVIVAEGTLLSPGAGER